MQGISLLFGCFPSFPGILGVQHREKSLVFWVVFLALCQKKERKIRVFIADEAQILFWGAFC